MGTETGIGYVDHTLNFWQGCPGHDDRPACDNCYMVRDRLRYGHSEEDCRRVKRSNDATFRAPLARVGRKKPFGLNNKLQPVHDPRPYKWPDGNRVFVCSWSDFFLEEADEWRAEAWDVMRQRPGLTFIIPTKQIERVKDCLPPDWGDGWPNVWLMPTVENQEVADKVIPILLSLPFKVRGISAEPLLGPLDLTKIDLLPEVDHKDVLLHLNALTGDIAGPGDLVGKLDFVIAGGETGKNARPSHPDWFRSLRDQSAEHGTAFNFKQWGEWVGEKIFGVVCDVQSLADNQCAGWGDGKTYWMKYTRVGKKKAGRLLDGVEHSDLPAWGVGNG